MLTAEIAKGRLAITAIISMSFRRASQNQSPSTSDAKGDFGLIVATSSDHQPGSHRSSVSVKGIRFKFTVVPSDRAAISKVPAAG
jgi:hypothetical protein